jgi:site-specific recombinase
LTPDHCSPTPVHAFTGAQSKAAGIPKALMLCRLQLSHALAATLERGVRLSLTYLLTRLEQHLDRVSLLYDMLGAPSREQLSPQCIADIDGFLRNTVIGETQRNSVRRHFSDLMGLLALRITENASRTGEHYITSDWRGYRTLWWSAMGAGFIVAFLALFKILSSDWPLTALGSGVVASMNYGLGFVIISLLHFTLATKQPAMTAATIADAIHVSEGEVRQDEGLVSLIIDTLRSQFAAILGNVFLALVTATIIAWWYAGYYGRPLVDEYYANKMLEQFDPLKGTLFYAAIAGVWLFVSGLVTGYFDNLATYARLGKRIGCLGWLTVVVGRARAQRIGAYVDRHFGVIVGNFLFGWMLGMTGALGVMLGLPLDVRHVTFSAATLGYGLAGLDYQVSAGTVLRASLGVALIGLVNLTVSFALALYVALRSRGATFASIPSLVVHTARRVAKNPLHLLMPPRGAVAKH